MGLVDLISFPNSQFPNSQFQTMLKLNKKIKSREREAYDEFHNVQGRLAGFEGGNAKIEAVTEGGLARDTSIVRKIDRDDSGAAV